MNQEEEAYRNKIDSLSITTNQQAEGYRRALALWDAKQNQIDWNSFVEAQKVETAKRREGKG